MKEARLMDWVKKVEKIKSASPDLSKEEDLSIALMNLLALEEHFYFTAMKTNDQRYLDVLREVRDVRKNMLARILKNPAGEEWCISKHLLAASMRLMEVGTKELGKGKKKEALEYFGAASRLHALFFAINHKMIPAGNPVIAVSDKSIFNRVYDTVKEIVDCCKE